MVLQSGVLSRLSARSNVRICCRHVQTASIAVWGKPRTGSLKSLRHQDVFPVHKAVLTRIRSDVLLKDAYKGRIVDKKKTSKELQKGRPIISDQYVSSATQQLEVLTQQELIDLVVHLARCTLSEEKLHTDLSTLQILEKECCSRAKNWDSANLLLVADAFFIMSYRCAHYLSSVFREFEHRWTSMAIKKEDVVQLAMCIMIGRKFPLLLVKNIEKFLNLNVEEFSAGELSVICSAFFITNTSFRNVEAMEKLANAVLHSVPNGELKAYQMGNVLKALRHAHFAKLSFYDNFGSLLSSSTALCRDSAISDLSNVAFTYASLRISSEVLFSKISSNAVRLIQSRCHMRVKDIGRLVWSFSLLQEPLDEVLKTRLLFMLRHDTHLMEQFSEAFIEALLGLAMQKTYPVDLLQKLFSAKFPNHGLFNFVTFCGVVISVPNLSP